jgi:protein-S-isoprenylcysteine O-methyltransferase Ste14
VKRFDRHVFGDLFARTFIGALFVLLCLNLWADFQRTGRFTGLLFLASESLVVVLTILRRRASVVDRSVPTAILTTASLLGPPLMRAPEGLAPLLPDLFTALVSTVGVTIVIIGKVTIGRSFGIAPANRGIVARGPYSFVRHPIYAGYLITHAAALAAYPTMWNVVILVGGDVALVLRALAEERVLSQDSQYRDYCGRVAWHLVPGVF